MTTLLRTSPILLCAVLSLAACSRSNAETSPSPAPSPAPETKSRGSEPSKSSDSAPENKKATAPSSGSSGGALGIRECDDYLKRLDECGETASFVGMSRKGFQIKLDEGKSRADIAKSCSTLLRVYKCKNQR